MADNPIKKKKKRRLISNETWVQNTGKKYGIYNIYICTCVNFFFYSNLPFLVFLMKIFKV